MTHATRNSFLGTITLCIATALPALSQRAVVTLHDLTGSSPEGSGPVALIQGSDWNLYGTFTGGGANGAGAVFKLTRSGILTILHAFATPIVNQTSGAVTNADGEAPAGLVQGADGYLYGTASEAGPNSTGTIYRVSTSGSFQLLHALAGATGSTPSYPEGNSPYAIVQAADGNLYGTCLSGGSADKGVIFKMTTAGTYSVLYSLQAADGFLPKKLIAGPATTLYGTCLFGGASLNGTVFSITTSGTFTRLYALPASGADGAEPVGLALAPGGALYGVCATGGDNNGGTLFTISSTGSFTRLYSFPPAGQGSDGSNPTTIILASDNNLYGGCSSGGPAGDGTLFKATTAGQVTTEHAFSSLSSGSPFTNNDGADPVALTQVSDGNLIGMAAEGGTAGAGVAFKLVTVNSNDINLDNSPDLFFQYQVDGSLGYWTMAGATKSAGGAFSPSSPGSDIWQVVGSGDLNGDSNVDLVFQNSQTGDIAYWMMNGAQQTAKGLMTPSNPGSTAWRLASVVDLNGDFSPDLIFQNTQTGAIVYWLMNGTTQIGRGAFTPASPGSLSWRLMGANHNYTTGATNLFWQYTPDGTVAYWTYNSALTRTAYGLITPSNPGGSGWVLSGLADVNGDGQTDLIWQYQPTGKLAYWTMNGSSATGTGIFSPNSTGSSQWLLVGNR